MSDCLGLKVGLETEGKWTRRIFLEWWKYSKYGLLRWLHNYVIYSKALSCTLKTGEFDWMLSILQDILKWKKKKCSGPSEVLSHHHHCVPSQHTGQRQRNKQPPTVGSLGGQKLPLVLPREKSLMILNAKMYYNSQAEHWKRSLKVVSALLGVFQLEEMRCSDKLSI